MEVTLLTENTRVRYTGDGVLKEFSYPFNPIDLSYVKVYKNLQPVTAPDVTISSGVVTFNTAPAEGDSIVIIREKPLTYDSGIVSKGIISPDSLDNLAVELLGQIQQVNEKLDRVPVYPIDTAMTGEDIINEFNQNVSDVRDAKISVEGKVEEINIIVSSGLTEITEATSESKTQITEEKNVAISAIETSTAPLIERAETAATEAETSRANAEEWAKSVDAENIVHRTGDEEVGGNKTFIGNNIFTGNNVFKGPTTPIKIDRNGANFVEVTTLDNNIRTGGFRNIKETNNVNSTIMYVSSEDGTSIKGYMGISYDGSSAYTYAPTPATSDNSTKIANTEYTNNFINSIRTNCITAIPQDIKLELNNGTLTLKAGSKVYIPNGAGVFNTVNITSDKSISDKGFSSGALVIFINFSGTSIRAVYTSFCTSGTTAPSDNNYRAWYDTTNNLVKSYANGSYMDNMSLPIAVCTYVNTKGFTSIDQVFNGFGYIGSTIFALPGVEGLLPNRRNTDESLNNIKWKANSVITFTNSNPFAGTFYFGVYENKQELAEYECTVTYYDQVKNIIVDTYPDPDADRYGWSLWGVLTKDSTGRITSFKPKTVFQATDYNDFKQLDDSAAKLATANTFTGANTFVDRPLFNYEILMADTTGTAPDNPPSQIAAYGTLRWLVKATKGATGGYGGGQELFRIQPIISNAGWFSVPVTYVYKNACELFNFGCDADGNNPFFRTITPATTDNSTNVATTNWFNKKIQVVSTLPASPDANVYYFIPE